MFLYFNTNNTSMAFFGLKTNFSSTSFSERKKKKKTQHVFPIRNYKSKELICNGIKGRIDPRHQRCLNDKGLSKVDYYLPPNQGRDSREWKQRNFNQGSSPLFIFVLKFSEAAHERQGGIRSANSFRADISKAQYTPPKGTLSLPIFAGFHSQPPSPYNQISLYTSLLAITIIIC